MLILWGAWLGWTRPFGAHPGFSPAPKGVLPPRIRPEGVDTRPKKTAITMISALTPTLKGDDNFDIQYFTFVPFQNIPNNEKDAYKKAWKGTKDLILKHSQSQISVQ